MKAIDPHIHMVSRTTDDYLQMAVSGIHTVAEPSFWAGFDRKSVDGFYDYFHQLTDTEPARAARFGIKHYCWIGLNAKEAENLDLAQGVLAILPEFLDRSNALGIGEVGLNKNSRNEMAILEMHLELAVERNELLLIHTPHLEDKLKGTRMIIDMIRSEPRLDPARILIDHAEEHTIKEIRDNGFWYGLTLYPNSKGSPERAIDAVEIYGSERLCVNSSADWSVSDPLSILKCANEMRRRGFTEEIVSQVFYENPKAFLGQSPKFSAV